MPDHKFAEHWRAWTINFNPNANPFGTRGEMNLTSMDPLGKLAKGKHYKDESGKEFEIEGEATDTDIKLRRTDGFGRWEGRLFFDFGQNMAIAGKYFTPVAPPPREKGAKSPPPQEEEPWIITKP